MKHSKSHGGTRGCGAVLSGLVIDYKAYQRWVKTAHERAQFVEVMLSTANKLSQTRFVFLFVLLLYVPSQQLWSLRDGQFT